MYDLTLNDDADSASSKFAHAPFSQRLETKMI
jgi:hypothetical protein